MSPLLLSATLLSVDSLVVSIALGASGVPKPMVRALALLFGLCDGTASLVGMSLAGSLAERLGTIGHFGTVIFLFGYIALVLCAVQFSQRFATLPKRSSKWLLVLPVLMSLDNLTATHSLVPAHSPLLEAFVFGLISAAASWLGFKAAYFASKVVATLFSRTKMVHGPRYASGLIMMGAGVALILS